MIHQIGLEQGLNVSRSRGVGTNAARNNHKEQPTSRKKCQIEAEKGNCRKPALIFGPSSLPVEASDCVRAEAGTGHELDAKTK